MKTNQVGTAKKETRPFKRADVSRLFQLGVICWFQACQKHQFGPSILRGWWIFLAAHVASWQPGVLAEAKLYVNQRKRVENSTCPGRRGEDNSPPRLSTWSLWWLLVFASLSVVTTRPGSVNLSLWQKWRREIIMLLLLINLQETALHGAGESEFKVVFGAKRWCGFSFWFGI